MSLWKQKYLNILPYFGLVAGIFLFAAHAQAANFTRNLRVGSTGDDVQALQQYLNAQGFTIAASGPGSPGNETKKFGSLTKMALIKFQEHYASEILQPTGVNQGTGNFYDTTRQFVNQHFNNLSNNIISESPPGHNTTSSSGSYTIGGTVTGISGTIILQNNHDVLAIKPGESSNFEFPTKLNSGQPYTITIVQAPASQKCYFRQNQGGNGIVNNSDVAVDIQCTSNIGWNPFMPPPIVGAVTFTIGGSITGLSGTVVLRSNGQDTISASANGAFTFAAPIASGQPYSVTIFSQPANQTCTVSSGSGIAITNITNIAVSCVNNTYTIGGVITGLTGTVILKNNGGDALSTSTNSSFTFATATTTGGSYTVTVFSQPSGQTCTVTNGSGTIAGSNITNVSVGCATNPSITLVSPNSGGATGGDTVTITGSHFTGATAVHFGATNAASFTVVNDSTITVTSPAGIPGAVDITVTTSTGTSATNFLDRFTYTLVLG